jgi:hypothetical protein
LPMRDPHLPHQIVLVFDGHKRVRVSCNCLSRPRKGAKHQTVSWVTHEVMPGFPDTVRDSWAIYNDPKNHRENKGVVFFGPLVQEESGL